MPKQLFKSMLLTWIWNLKCRINEIGRQAAGPCPNTCLKVLLDFSWIPSLLQTWLSLSFQVPRCACFICNGGEDYLFKLHCLGKHCHQQWHCPNIFQAQTQKHIPKHIQKIYAGFIVPSTCFPKLKFKNWFQNKFKIHARPIVPNIGPPKLKLKNKFQSKFKNICRTYCAKYWASQAQTQNIFQNNAKLFC